MKRTTTATKSLRAVVKFLEAFLQSFIFPQHPFLLVARHFFHHRGDSDIQNF